MDNLYKISKKAINLLEQAGYEAYIVGGIVRNSLMGIPALDIDICTNALPNEISEVFKNFCVYETGIKHGTVTVVIDSIPAEITTYRIDGEYENHRSPKEVLFSNSLKEDLSRRDFTINAMAYNENTGIVDLFDGKGDLSNKLIRCVGRAEERFEEDALRILRALRFSSVLGFNIENETRRAILSKYHLLSYVSKERITDETIKLMSGKYAKQVIKEFFKIFLFLSGGAVSDEIFCEENDPLILLSFFENTNFLRLSANNEKTLNFIRKNRYKTIITDYDILNLLNSVGIDAAEKILRLSKNRHLLKNFFTILQNGCYNVKMLGISGADILKLGYSGKAIGHILSEVLNLVMLGEISNNYVSISDFIKKNKFFT